VQEVQLRSQLIQAIQLQQVAVADNQKALGLGEDDWHLFDEEELLVKLQTSREGLSDE
jgi:hypothetical protein